MQITLEELCLWQGLKILIVQTVNFLFVLKMLLFSIANIPVWGYVIKGMEFVDNIKLGEPPQRPR